MYWSNRLPGRARTSKFIIEWYEPQYSAQRPTKDPGRSIFSITQVFFWSFFSGSGKTSRLNRNSGIQNEWMTSSECWVKEIGRSVGRTSSGTSSVVPIVATGAPTGFRDSGYANSQFHWKATTSILSSLPVAGRSTTFWTTTVK